LNHRENILLASFLKAIFFHLTIMVIIDLYMVYLLLFFAGKIYKIKIKIIKNKILFKKHLSELIGDV